jgi:hypothetical protein
VRSKLSGQDNPRRFAVTDNRKDFSPPRPFQAIRAIGFCVIASCWNEMLGLDFMRKIFLSLPSLYPSRKGRFRCDIMFISKVFVGP